ncbi:hypothetical protein [Neorhizobium tomejilense]|uniref:hypothetical protein n=1 Tax=Neorhizobium tomejilense TaxID=2093828 RepID=UPI000CF9C794|nr:hypothetical protein [Neorhizobium tomejilense]
MSGLTLVTAARIDAVSDLSAAALDYGRATLSANTMRAYKATGWSLKDSAQLGTDRICRPLLRRWRTMP